MKITFSKVYMKRKIEAAETLYSGAFFFNFDPTNYACAIGEICRDSVIETQLSSIWASVPSHFAKTLADYIDEVYPGVTYLEKVNDDSAPEDRKTAVLAWLEKYTPDFITIEV